MMRELFAAALVLCGCLATAAAAQESEAPAKATGRSWFVSASGQDSDPGTKLLPFATLRQACEVARSGDTVYLRGGEYAQTLVPVTSGTPDAPITFARYADEKATLVSGRRITRWQPIGNGVYVADCPAALEPGRNQVICNGELMIEARTPSIEDQNELVHVFGLHRAMPAIAMENGVRTLDARADLQTSDAVHYVGRHGGAWGTQTAIGTFDGAGVMNVQARTSKGYLGWWAAKGDGYVAGARAYLDCAREWYLDAKAGKLYLIPPQGTDPNTMEVYVKDRDYAIDLKDRKHIVVDGVITLMGGVRMENSERCTIRNSELFYGGHHSFFENPYTYEGDISPKSGVFVTGNRNLIERCEIAWNSAASVVIGGEDNRVINCRIHDSGLLGSYYSGIYVFQHEKLRGGGHEIARNTLYNLGRGAIHISSIGGWADPGKYAKPMDIHHNWISNAMMICDDGGAIYQFCTDGAGSQLHHNWVFGRKGCMVYFDNHSFGWQVHHNVIQGDVNVNAPAERIHIFNNTMLLTNYSVPKYFWERGNFVSNNVDPYYQEEATWDGATCNGTRPPYVTFAAEGAGGLKYRVKEVDEAGLSKVKPRKASVAVDALPAFRSDYFGAYEYGKAAASAQEPWVAGCDWGGAVPETPQRQGAPLSVQASSFTSSDGMRNNALFAATTAEAAWACYKNIDLSAGYSHVILEVMMDQEMADAEIELRLDGREGERIARSTIPYRSNERHQFFPAVAKLKAVTGRHDLYLAVHAKKKLNISQFTFAGAGKTPLYGISPQQLVAADGNKKVEATAYTRGSRVLLMADAEFRYPGIWMTGSYDLKGCTPGSWVYFPRVDFGPGCKQLMLNLGDIKEYDDPNPRVELRSGAPDGPLLGALDIQKGVKDKWQEQRMELNNAVSGVHDLFIVFPRRYDGGLNYILFSQWVSPAGRPLPGD